MSVKGQVREVVYYRHYYLNFFNLQSKEVQKKLNWTLGMIATCHQIPEKYFKHIEGQKGLYEIRVEMGSNIFRIFSFFDEGNLIVLVNGFQKKSMKTPHTEIQRALSIRKQYYYEKENQ